MPCSKQILASLLLGFFSVSAQVMAETCSSARKCNANCSIAFNSHWRYGSPGLAADMQVCEQRCMARNPNCAVEQSEKRAHHENGGSKDVEGQPQKRPLGEKGK